MFPGHPYVRQETSRAEQTERDRAARLIREARQRFPDLPAGEVLAELETAVRQGHQRFAPRNIRPRGG